MKINLPFVKGRRPGGRVVYSNSTLKKSLARLQTAFSSLSRWIGKPVSLAEDRPLRWTPQQQHPAQTLVEQTPLTVINLNLWHDWPRHRRLPDRLETFARQVEKQGAHIVLLQEAVRTPEIEAHAWLAHRLGMQAVFKRANGHRESIGFEEGLAVLSRLPVGEIRHRTLKPSNGPLVRRVALGVEIVADCLAFWVFSTHLSLLRARNAAQLAHLRDWVVEVSGGRDALIGGDFNAHETSPQIQETAAQWIDTFRCLHPDKDASSHTLRWPWGSELRSHRLDYLFHKPAGLPWKVLDSDYLDCGLTPCSDHKAVVTRLVPGHQD